jgi:hypothetical protein
VSPMHAGRRTAFLVLAAWLVLAAPATGALEFHAGAQPMRSTWAAAREPAGPVAAGTGHDAPAGDFAGLRRDSFYVLSYQVGMIGILYALPESISNWSAEQKESYTASDWWDNVRNPQWDTDKLWLNYVAHPYWGAAYFVRARERGFDERGSFWYAVVMSSAFELGAEALFEQPSIQDLVVTPVAGAILGEYFMSVRDRIRARYGPGEQMPFGDRALLAVTDPLGAINRQVQSWLGTSAEASLVPYFGAQPLGAGSRYAQDQSSTNIVYGFRMSYRW